MRHHRAHRFAGGDVPEFGGLIDTGGQCQLAVRMKSYGADLIGMGEKSRGLRVGDMPEPRTLVAAAGEDVAAIRTEGGSDGAPPKLLGDPNLSTSPFQPVKPIMNGKLPGTGN